MTQQHARRAGAQDGVKADGVLPEQAQRRRCQPSRACLPCPEAPRRLRRTRATAVQLCDSLLARRNGSKVPTPLARRNGSKVPTPLLARRNGSKVPTPLCALCARAPSCKARARGASPPLVAPRVGLARRTVARRTSRVLGAASPLAHTLAPTLLLRLGPAVPAGVGIPATLTARRRDCPRVPLPELGRRDGRLLLPLRALLRLPPLMPQHCCPPHCHLLAQSEGRRRRNAGSSKLRRERGNLRLEELHRVLRAHAKSKLIVPVCARRQARETAARVRPHKARAAGHKTAPDASAAEADSAACG